MERGYFGRAPQGLATVYRPAASAEAWTFNLPKKIKANPVSHSGEVAEVRVEVVVPNRFLPRAQNNRRRQCKRFLSPQSRPQASFEEAGSALARYATDIHREG
jgi:hypothetical protein